MSSILPQKLANYDSARGAEAYKRDHATKLHRRWSNRRELAIYTRFFELAGRLDSMLDLPCGVGRLLPLFSKNAGRVIEADYSRTMLQTSRQDHPGVAAGYLRCSGLQIPLCDDAVEGVASIRLSHHIHEHEARLHHIRELFRVARRVVIVSWFSSTSLKSRIRQLRARFTSKNPKNTLHPDKVRHIAAQQGFQELRSDMISRIGSGHRFALFIAGDPFSSRQPTA